MKVRWYNIDLVKGFLIILVFLGHLIPGIQRETFLRYLIYSFHMPLFICVSGFLYKINYSNTDKAIFNFSRIKKLVHRVVIPWIVAVIIYDCFNNVFSGDFQFGSLLVSFVRPYYHLWFIPGYLCYIFIFRLLWIVLSYSKHRWIWMFIISFGISMTSMFTSWDLVLKNATLSRIAQVIHNDFRLYNFVFFTLGVFIRENKMLVFNLIATKRCFFFVVTTILFIINIVLFWNENHIYESFLYYILNIPLIIILLYSCVNSFFPRIKVIEFLGENSLPIYLYHVLCIRLATKVFGTSNQLGYYMMGILSFVVLCFIIKWLSKCKWVSSILFGNVKKFK